MRFSRILIAAGLLLLVSQAVWAYEVDGGRLGKISVFSSPEASKGLVILLPDPSSNPSENANTAQAIAQAGHTTAVVDTARYLVRLNHQTEACHPLSGDFKLLSRQLTTSPSNSDLQESTVLAGSGKGGALAYAVLAQSAPGDFSGAVTFQFVPELDGPVPLCSGAAYTPSNHGFRYQPAKTLPGFFRIATSSPNNPDFIDFEKAHKDVVFPIRPYDDFATAVIAILSAESGTAPDQEARLADLPIIPLPAKPCSQTMAIIYSGDGGWRDLDKQIGEKLQQVGIPVVGVDSLLYFWDKKSSVEVAQDLSLIIKHFTCLWNTPDVLLIGYSFGADIIPFAYNLLQPEQKASIRQITLLAMSRSAEFEVDTSEWLGTTPSSDTDPLSPELRRLDPGQVQCLYGEEDQDDTGCTDISLRTAEVVRTKGGHHFDGDYQAIAQRIIDGAVKRGARTKLSVKPIQPISRNPN